jgi:hypothetical protein
MDREANKSKVRSHIYSRYLDDRVRDSDGGGGLVPP